MALLDEMKNWLNSELPSQDEIKETIDRLSMNASANPLDKIEYNNVIKLLQAELKISSVDDKITVSASSKSGISAFPASVSAVKKALKAKAKTKPTKANGSRAASPIKDKGDITMIAKMMEKWGYVREAHLLIIGCNTALRYSDLRLMKFEHVNKSGELDGTGYMDEMVEQKTGKAKDVRLNATAMKYIKAQYDLLLSMGVDPIYVFQGTGNRTKSTPNPVSRSHVNKVFKEVSENLDLNFRFSTHSMRKSFAYHAYNNGKGIDIKVLQKLLNHRSEDDTFTYIGINAERVSQTYIDAEIEVSL